MSECCATLVVVPKVILTQTVAPVLQSFNFHLWCSNFSAANPPSHVVGRSPEHVADRSPEHVVGRSPKHVVGASPEHVVGRSPEHVVGRSPDRPTFARAQSVNRDSPAWHGRDIITRRRTWGSLVRLAVALTSNNIENKRVSSPALQAFNVRLRCAIFLEPNFGTESAKGKPIHGLGP